MDVTALASLCALRSALYAACGRRRDALFALCDALLATGPVPSPAHLSLHPLHRRGWGSLYDALAVGELTAPALQAALATYPLADGEPIYAVDASVWMRLHTGDAETSPERAVYYHPSIPRGIRRVSRSSPAGPSTGSLSSASPPIVGPLP